jgi:hypothetical protein
MLRDRPFARSFALAALVHLGAVATVRAYVARCEIPRTETRPTEITIDQPAEPPPTPEPIVAAPLPSAVPRAASEARVSRSAEHLTSRARASEEAPEPSAPVPTPAPSATPSADGWSPSVLRAGPGGAALLGLTPEERARSLAAPGTTGRGDASRGHDVAGMKAILSEHDLSLGLGQGGPLVTAVEDVTGSSRAPVDGSAAFVVDADETGAVISVRAVDVSSDEEAWREVAALLLAKMKNHPLHIRPGWRGVSVTLQVRSRLQAPDGASARGRLPLGARVALFPLKILSGSFDVTELTPQEFRRIDAWEADERPR